MVSEELIARCERDDRKAQYELYRALYSLMMSICSRYERNKQDAVARMNIGFLKILQNLGQRRKDVPFEPWCRRIVINTVIDEHRRERGRRENETVGLPMHTEDAGGANDYLKEMEAEAFAELLQQLPPMTRVVFNLFAMDGLTHAEIAEQLNMSPGTSKWHVASARATLQQRLSALASNKASIR